MSELPRLCTKYPPMSHRISRYTSTLPLTKPPLFLFLMDRILLQCRDSIPQCLIHLQRIYRSRFRILLLPFMLLWGGCGIITMYAIRLRVRSWVVRSRWCCRGWRRWRRTRRRWFSLSLCCLRTVHDRRRRSRDSMAAAAGEGDTAEEIKGRREYSQPEYWAYVGCGGLGVRCCRVGVLVGGDGDGQGTHALSSCSSFFTFTFTFHYNHRDP